MEKKP
eukprot:UN00537